MSTALQPGGTGTGTDVPEVDPSSGRSYLSAVPEVDDEGRGAHPPRPMGDPVPRRPRLTGVPAYLVTVVVAALTAAVVVEGSRGAWIAVAATAVLAGWGYLTVPSERRGQTVLPVRFVALGLGSLAWILGGTGVVSTRGMRDMAVVLLTSATATALAAAVGRLDHRPARILLAGDPEGIFHLTRQFIADPGVDVVAACPADTDDRVEPRVEIGGVPVRGSLTAVPRLTHDLKVDRVVAATGADFSAYDLRRLGWSLEGSQAGLSAATEVHGAEPHRVSPWVLGGRLVLDVSPTRRARGRLLVKGAVDRTLAAVGLVVLALPLGLLMLLVKLDSPGPALFRQVRSGRGGRTFKIVKLRTMTRDAESRVAELQALNSAAGPLFKVEDDPRVTRIGGFLRASSLDELPQLWNVVRGEMSLVGPRPCLPSERSTFDDWVERRLCVKPGITGPWQVNGRSHLSWDRSVRLDLDYVDNWTLRRDLGIAVKTVRAVLRRDGAY